MIKLKSTGKEYGDATQDYNVELKKECTVEEFISCVLKEYPQDWGYIGIYNSKNFSVFGDPKLSYERGNLITDSMPEDILSKKIKLVKANGGWSRMDYIIFLE